MHVYIKPDNNWFGLYSAASGDLKARFTTEQDARDFADIWGWSIVNRPLPMDGTDNHQFGEE